MDHPIRRDPWVRAAAIQAASRWQPWTPGQPQDAQVESLFRLAELFAAWIEGDE